MPIPTSTTEVIASTGYEVLTPQSSSDAVRQLQIALRSKGFYTGTIDGVYGPATIAAVIEFQKANNLKVDGVAGPSTQRVLFETASAITYATLKQGDSGNAVRNLQYTLYELGYFDASINGNYGPLTKEAVQAFQARNGLPATGIADNATLQLLYSSHAVTDLTPDVDYTRVQLGDQGEAVLAIRSRLNSLAYPVSVGSNIFDEAIR